MGVVLVHHKKKVHDYFYVIIITAKTVMTGFDSEGLWDMAWWTGCALVGMIEDYLTVYLSQFCDINCD